MRVEEGEEMDGVEVLLRKIFISTTPTLLHYSFPVGLTHDHFLPVIVCHSHDEPLARHQLLP
jgi:hypothetical protein